MKAAQRAGNYDDDESIGHSFGNLEPLPKNVEL